MHRRPCSAPRRPAPASTRLRSRRAPRILQPGPPMAMPINGFGARRLHPAVRPCHHVTMEHAACSPQDTQLGLLCLYLLAWCLLYKAMLCYAPIPVCMLHAACMLHLAIMPASLGYCSIIVQPSQLADAIVCICIYVYAIPASHTVPTDPVTRMYTVCIMPCHVTHTRRVIISAPCIPATPPPSLLACSPSGWVPACLPASRLH
jgi:hypothetical protein